MNKVQRRAFDSPVADPEELTERQSSPITWAGQTFSFHLFFHVGEVVMVEFGRPAWWASIALQGKKGPLLLDRLEPQAINWFLKVGRLVLSGVGEPALEKLFAGDRCTHLQRPATDRELARADLSRMWGEIIS